MVDSSGRRLAFNILDAFVAGRALGLDVDAGPLSPRLGISPPNTRSNVMDTEPHLWRSLVKVRGADAGPLWPTTLHPPNLKQNLLLLLLFADTNPSTQRNHVQIECHTVDQVSGHIIKSKNVGLKEFCRLYTTINTASQPARE